jgi:hypothetical protein
VDIEKLTYEKVKEMVEVFTEKSKKKKKK